MEFSVVKKNPRPFSFLIGFLHKVQYRTFLPFLTLFQLCWNPELDKKVESI